MKQELKELRALAEQIAALQTKAKALGLFAHDRELLENAAAAGGGLFTCRPESLDEDTGLRFEKLLRDRFRCPACGAMVGELDVDAPIVKQKGGKHLCRNGRKPRN